LKIIDKIKKLNIVIPNAPSPVGSYVAYKRINNLLYISGQISIKNNGDIIKGKVGKDLNLEEGKQAALVCGINIISQVKAACNNDLEKVKNCIKLTGYVNSTDNFTEQPQVLNSASELMVNVFGDLGKHTRAAISVNSLPLNASVEIDAIFEII
tara:strand:- start:55 stop:516 length:462 start_codon:yes stop_codon:yes gene_type:complete